MKKLTFIIHDSKFNKIVLAQATTDEWSIERAWEKYHKENFKNKEDHPDIEWMPATRYSFVGAIHGHVNWMNEHEPLRKLTKEEADELQQKEIIS